MKRAYYARCISIDNTPQYNRDIATIREIGFEPMLQDQEAKEAGYKAEGMEFFLRQIREKADALFFRGTPSGHITAGVVKEVSVAQEKGIPVIELPSSLSMRGMTVEQTREYLLEVGKR